MRFEIDLTTVPELKTIPESVVLLKAVDVKEGKSQAGNDKLIYECEILEPPEIVEQVGAGVVVMGAIARNAIKRVFIGSTAERVMDSLPCDLLIIKPGWFKAAE